MKDLREKLNSAYKLMSAIPVSGDNIEIMAAARELIREAYKMAGEASENG